MASPDKTPQQRWYLESELKKSRAEVVRLRRIEEAAQRVSDAYPAANQDWWIRLREALRG